MGNCFSQIFCTYLSSVYYVLNLDHFFNVNCVFFFQQSEDAKAQEASRKEFQETEKLKNLFSDCKVFLSREVPREILVFVIRYKQFP